MAFPTVVLIASTVFPTQYQCMQNLNEEASYQTRPIHSTISGRNVNSAYITLYGASIYLKCRGRWYTAHLFEEKTEKTYIAMQE